jgi:hypothetical protein
LFLAVQLIKVSSKNITTLNKRLQWQIDNHSRDLRYVKLDSTTLQLMIFTNSFFANNRICFHRLIMSFVSLIQSMLTLFIDHQSNANASLEAFSLLNCMH